MQQADPILGWWLLPRGHLMCFPMGRRQMGQDEGMLYPRVYSPSGAFCDGVKANPFRVHLPKKWCALRARHRCPPKNLDLFFFG